MTCRKLYRKTTKRTSQDQIRENYLYYITDCPSFLASEYIFCYENNNVQYLKTIQKIRRHKKEKKTEVLTALYL